MSQLKDAELRVHSISIGFPCELVGDRTIRDDTLLTIPRLGGSATQPPTKVGPPEEEGERWPYQQSAQRGRQDQVTQGTVVFEQIQHGLVLFPPSVSLPSRHS